MYKLNNLVLALVLLVPSIAFSQTITISAGNVNSGWIFGPGNVGVSTTNNVGIGSSRPSQALDVNGTIRTTNLIATSINGSTQCLHANTNGNISGTGSDCGSGGGGGPSGWTLGPSNVGISTTNNVGIGSSSPGVALDVQGTLRVSGPSQIVFSPNGGTITNPSGSTISSNLTFSAPILQMTTGASSGYVMTSQDDFGNGSWNPLQWSNSNSVPGAIFINQNVGINTATPGQAFDVQGTIRATGFIGSGSLLTNLPFWTKGNVGISTTSNVGIGSFNPGQILDVQGTIRTTGFTLNLNPSSGYILTSNAVGVGTWMPPNGGGGGGSVTSVGLSSPNSTLTIGSTPITTAGTITGDINLSHANTWTGQQIFNSANVGIGSSTPGQTLDVNGTMRAIAFVSTSGGLTGNTNYFGSNMGIGSTNPGQSLDVQGTVRGTALTIFGGTSSQFLKADGSTDSNTYCQSGGTNCPGGTGDPWLTQSGSGNLGISTVSPYNVGIGTTKGNAGLSVMSGNVGIGTWNPAGSLIITTGNVGIGSILPQSQFDIGSIGVINSTIGGTGQVMRIAGMTGFNGISIADFRSMNTGTAGDFRFIVDDYNADDYLAVDTPSSSNTATLFGQTRGSINAIFNNATTNFRSLAVGTVGANPLILGTNNLARMFISSTGNIGIGTSSGNVPQQLSIFNGNTNEFNVASTGQVFANGNVGVGSATPGQILDVQGTVRMSKLGTTLSIASGSNGCQGQATLASGTVTVSTTCAPSSSQGIFLQDATTGSLVNVGTPTVGTVTGGTSFVINSSNALDSSNVNWWILKAS